MMPLYTDILPTMMSNKKLYCTRNQDNSIDCIQSREFYLSTKRLPLVVEIVSFVAGCLVVKLRLCPSDWSCHREKNLRNACGVIVICVGTNSSRFDLLAWAWTSPSTKG